MAKANGIVRSAAALLVGGCFYLSFGLISKVGTLGFAIGGWTGLRGYEQAIMNARQMAQSAMIRLAVVQVLGGTFPFIALRRNLRITWSPLFVLGFSIATVVLFWVYVESSMGIHQLWRTTH
jgi:hypothetical protein